MLKVLPGKIIRLRYSRQAEMLISCNISKLSIYYSNFKRCSSSSKPINSFNDFLSSVKDKESNANININTSLVENPIINTSNSLHTTKRPEFKPSVNQRMTDIQGKFSLPFGWGWCYPFIKFTSGLLLSIQASTGLPWLYFFFASAVAIRLLTFPLVLTQVIQVNKVSKITPNIRLLFRCAKDAKIPIIKKVYYFIRASRLYFKDIKVNPFMFMLYNLIQIPVFFLMIFSIRKISSENNLSSEGILWFKDLHQADPYMILPLISAAITYYNLGVSLLILFDF